MNIFKFECCSLKNVASISIDFDSEFLPEATFFKLEYSNLNMFISIIPLKTYLGT